VLEVVREFGAARNASPAQVALAWLLTRPAVTSVLLGARDRSQLEANLSASALDLTAEEVAALDSVSARPLPYPYWHQAVYNECFRF
jgi:aryl-alcohol dehydrogenase-like predicted oxidoreductase